MDLVGGSGEGGEGEEEKEEDGEVGIHRSDLYWETTSSRRCAGERCSNSKCAFVLGLCGL